MTRSQDNSPDREPAPRQAVAVPVPTAVSARRVRFTPPRRFVRAGKEYTAAEGVEIDVDTDVDFPIAGTGPALFIGDEVLTESVRLGERRYRFFAPDASALRDGAPVAMGIAGTGVPRKERASKLRFSLQR